MLLPLLKNIFGNWPGSKTENLPDLQAKVEKLLQDGDTEQARNILDHCLERNPQDLAVIFLLGKLEAEAGNLARAKNHISNVLAMSPDHPAARSMLAHILYKLNDHDAVVQLLHGNIGTVSANPDDWVILAVSAYSSNHIKIAKHAYEQACAFYPESPEIWLNRGIILYKLLETTDAKYCFEKAVELNPDSALAYNNLGLAEQRLGNLTSAETAFTQAVVLDPDYVNARINIAANMFRRGHHTEALDTYRNTLDAHPSRLGLVSKYLYSLNFISFEDKDYVGKEHCRLMAAVDIESDNVLRFQNTANINRPLRVGYVSADFFQHSVAYFIEPLIKTHNRNNIQVFCYSNTYYEDEITQRIKSYDVTWRNITPLSDIDAVKQIKTDEIDILVDLSGHTGGNRLKVFASRAAPVQVSYLGYPNTTGLKNIDYRITDNIADPDNESSLYTEELVRLPRCFLVYIPHDDTPEVINNTHEYSNSFTFGCFNNFAKITSETFDAWVRILKQQDDSRLLLKSPAFLDDDTAATTLGRFVNAGISADRITLLPWVNSMSEHLALYQQVDIALDTFPYNGTTTTIEALWMGVPVITKTGNCHASRVGASILNSVGLSEFICSDAHNYIEIANRLANDPEKLAALRIGLRDRLSDSPLLSHASFTELLETKYREFWSAWCRQSSGN